MKKIVCFHLFNDYSGSPKVLKSVLAGLSEQGYSIDLVTSHGGALDELKERRGIRFRQYNYHFAHSTAARVWNYLRVQLLTFFIALGYAFKKDVIIYINTILPVGAALGGRIAGKKVIYHYHENAGAKSRAYRILAWFMQRLASRIICVSQYQRSFLKRKKGVSVVPNALPKEFVAALTPNPHEAFKRKRVLMLGSLKSYKGTKEFIEIADRLQQFSFEIVLNENQEKIDTYLKEEHITTPPNLTVYPRQNNVVTFYNNASLVLNLTDKRQAIETFGLTALEAMAAGLPVIVPTVGGIAEMVADGVNGYRIDVKDIEKIQERVENILTNVNLYITLSKNAHECSKKYSVRQMTGIIAQVLESVNS